MVLEPSVTPQLHIALEAGKVMLTHDLVEMEQGVVHKIHVALSTVVVLVCIGLVALHLLGRFEESTTR